MLLPCGLTYLYPGVAKIDIHVFLQVLAASILAIPENFDFVLIFASQRNFLWNIITKEISLPPDFQ